MTRTDGRGRALAALGTLALAAGLGLAGGLTAAGADEDELKGEDYTMEAARALADGEVHVRGWLVHARLEPVNLLLDAKLDSGAKTTSIDAEILRGPGELDPDEIDEDAIDDDVAGLIDLDAAVDASEEEDSVDEEAEDETIVEEEAEEERPKNAKPKRPETVVFRITNESGRSRTLRREVVRYVEIKARDGRTIQRPVVELSFCIAGVRIKEEVNLADRSEFNYPLLVGRNMLDKAGILVDSRDIYTHKARCPKPDKDS